jgi:hypothetical protein
VSAGQRIHWFRGADAEIVVAVWVARAGRIQFHAGLYHRDHGAASILHFAWDRELRDDAPGDVGVGRGQGLVALALDDDDAQTLCALCRRVVRRHSSTLRYRFLEWRPRFELGDAEIVPSSKDESYGFTCATFVLAMLRSAVVEELLALDQWPLPSPEDADHRWQRSLAERLCPRDADPEDAAKVLAGIGARRVLPTDVAGGAMHPRERWPVGLVDARREGDEMAVRLP